MNVCVPDEHEGAQRLFGSLSTMYTINLCRLGTAFG